MDPLRRQLTDPQVERLLKAVERLLAFDREVPGQVMATLLYIAAHDNCHKQALEEDLKFTTASASRNTDKLSRLHRLGKPGFDLIIKEADPSNKRRQQLRLNKRGQRLIEQIKEDLYGNKTPDVSGQATTEVNDQEL
jgi:DNA-binding MarR family transcriptional regulator